MNSMQQTAMRKKSFRRNAAERKGTMKIYLYGMSDDEIVRFASACAGVAVSRYPMQLDPPTLREIEELIIRNIEE